MEACCCHRCADDSESEEIRAEIRTVNNLSDSELRVQLQKSNDETYERRAQPSECAERARSTRRTSFDAPSA